MSLKRWPTEMVGKKGSPRGESKESWRPIVLGTIPMYRSRT